MSIGESLSKAANLALEIRDAEKKAALTTVLLAAQGEALNLQERLGKVQQENAELREQLKRKESLEAMEADLFYARHAYWRKSETIISAYCPTCWDKERVLVRLARDGRNGGMCLACRNRYSGVYEPNSRATPGDPATCDYWPASQGEILRG